MSKTNCQDHLGHEYDSIAAMCRHWGIKSGLFLSRMNRGWTVEEALTKELETTGKKVTDHLGNKYDSILEMCAAYGIHDKTFSNRIARGWSVEQALTSEALPTIMIESIDHLGNKFRSVDSMCKYWGIKPVTFRRRVDAGWDIEKALTTSTAEQTVYDHMGNGFKSHKDMCKYWGVGYGTYLGRKERGLDLEACLTMDKVVAPKECIDHTGRVFKTRREMCKHWGINETTFITRLSRGYTVEQALTKDKFGIKCTDHLGQSFDSVSSMCKHWGIDKSSFEARVERGWSIQDALTKPTKSRDYRCKDHLGNEFSSMKEMSEHWGIDYGTFCGRVKRGWSIENILTTPTIYCRRDFTAFGEAFTVKSASRAFGMAEATVVNRFNNRWDIEASLVVKSTSRGHSDTKIKFIGLDGKAYYKVLWDNNPVTVRQIVEHYHPELLEAYDRSNPTGEYRPYKVNTDKDDRNTY